MKKNLTHFYCKHALVLLLCLFVSISTMLAVPAWSGWQTKSQPDGTTIVVRQIGDEFYHYWETEDGRLALQQADGTFIVSDKPLPTNEQVSVRRKASKMYQSKPRKTIGKITLAPRGLVILVEFPDVKFKDENNKQAFNDMLNTVGYNYDGAPGSARDYFYAQSNHTYEPVFDVFGPVMMPHELAYYGAQDYGADGEYGTDDDGDNDMYMADFVIDAVFAAHNAGCKFNQYDSDEDGQVDIIYFFYAGKGQAAGGTPETIWPHNWNLLSALYYNRTHCEKECEYYAYVDGDNLYSNLPVLDGYTINNYVCSAELKYSGGRSGIGTLCHEFSHVLGMPDYYDTEYGINHSYQLTPGKWSIMDQGSYNDDERTPPNYSIFDKYFMGWAEPKHLAKNISQDVEMTTGYNDAYQITGGSERVPFSCTDTVYYIENRQNTGWDKYVPGHGMLVWQVVYQADWWAANQLNNVAVRPRYTVKSAKGSILGIGSDMFPNYDPFPGYNEVEEFSPFQGCSLTRIKETTDGNITFSFNSDVVCRNVTATVTGCESYKLSDKCVPDNMDLVVTFVPEEDTYDISSLSVKVGGTELTQGTEYALSEDHRKLTVYATAFAAHSGDVTINAAWAKAFVTYKFSYTTENCTYPANGLARLGEELNLIVTPDNGYSLSVEEWCWTITSNTYTTLHMGVDFSYDRVTNTLKIFNVAGDLYIMPKPVLADYWYADGELYKEESCGSTIYTPYPKPGNCSNGREFIGWCNNPTYHHLTDAPTFIKSGESKEEVSTSFYAVYAQFGIPKVINSTKSFNDATTTMLPKEYSAEASKVVDGNFYNMAQFCRDASAYMLKWRGADDANGPGYIYNSYSYSDPKTYSILKLHSIAITYNSADAYRNISLKIGSTKNPTSGRTITPTIKGDVYTFDCTDGELCDYFVLTNGNHEAFVDKIDINLTPAEGYLNYSTKCDEAPAYTVVFRDDDGTLQGEPQVVESGKPAIAPSLHKDCYDLTWDKDFSKVMSDMTVTAVWTPKSIEYTYSATSEDENKGTVAEIQLPTCAEPIYIVRADAKEGYEFLKWSDNNTDNPREITVTGNIAIQALWKAKIWTIKWMNGDQLLETDYVPTGEKPVYDGAEPTKAGDAEYTYKFSGWTPEVVKATEDATYTATFKATKNKYTVTFMNGDKMEKEEQVEYGSSATPPEIEIPDCKLLTWAPDYSNITGNLTVYAQWSDKPLGFTWSATSADDKMGKVDINKTPTCSDPELIALATANDGYEFVKWSDGATENPHTVTVDKNIELTAIFEEIEVEPVEVTSDTDIKDIVTDASTEIEVTTGGHLTVSTATTIHSITLEYSESGHAQLSGITNLTVDEIEVKMQFPTPIGPLDEQWFAIAVPFAVSMATGIRYEGSDKPAIPGTDFIVEEYDGAMRATTQRGWKSVKADATLYPGHMYMISMASHATWYLKAADPKTLSEPTSVGISAYDSKIGAHHSGWNGIANTLFTCASGDAAGISYATTFNNKKGVYEAQATGSYVFGAAVPFFVQTAAGGVLNFTDESGTPAPLRAQYAQSSSIAAVTLSDGNYTDKAFWTVNADKQDVYTIGSDLQKMQVANAGVPQISILAYNMKLSAYEAPFDGTATIPVSLYTPAEGTYSIAVSNVPDDLNVLLMKNGNLVWDITSSSFAADLQAGDNSGYSLYVQRIKEMGTGVNNNGNEAHNVQKVLFNDRIYIIRDGKTYVITGECVNQ